MIIYFLILTFITFIYIYSHISWVRAQKGIIQRVEALSNLSNLTMEQKKELESLSNQLKVSSFVKRNKELELILIILWLFAIPLDWFIFIFNEFLNAYKILQDSYIKLMPKINLVEKILNHGLNADNHSRRIFSYLKLIFLFLLSVLIVLIRRFILSFFIEVRLLCIQRNKDLRTALFPLPFTTDVDHDIQSCFYMTLKSLTIFVSYMLTNIALFWYCNYIFISEALHALFVVLIRFLNGEFNKTILSFISDCLDIYPYYWFDFFSFDLFYPCGVLFCYWLFYLAITVNPSKLWAKVKLNFKMILVIVKRFKIVIIFIFSL